MMGIPPENKSWIPGFSRPLQPRLYGNYRRPDFPPFLLRHTPEAAGWSPDFTASYVHKHMRNKRPHFWAQNGLTASLRYGRGFGGSKARKGNTPKSKAVEGFLYQFEPLDQVAWALRGAYDEKTGKPITFEMNGQTVRAETNHAHVIQGEITGYAADMQNLTDAELEWERDRVWLPICVLLGIDELRPVSRIGHYPPIRLPWDEWMDQAWREEHNFGGHQDIPANTHWDCGRYPYGEMAQEVNAKLKELGSSAKKAKAKAKAQQTKLEVGIANAWGDLSAAFDKFRQDMSEVLS